jgi:FkbM family methyltransferase
MGKSKKEAEIIPLKPTSNADYLAHPFYTIAFQKHNYLIMLPHAEHDYIQGLLAKTSKPYESEMLLDMEARIKPNELVVDVGANIGNHSLYLLACGAEVIAIEPNPILVSSIQKSLEANNWTQRGRVMPFAAGRRSSNAHYLKEIPENLGGMSLEVGEGDIQVKTLDSILNGASPAVIKIDVESMELDVLMGAGRTISEARPLIYIECASKESFQSIFNWFERENYIFLNTFNATPTHLFAPIEKVDQLGLSQASHERFEETIRTYLANEKHSEIIIALEAANQKYRIISQQHSTIKEQLEGANQKYRDTTERVSELKEKLSQEEIARQEVLAQLLEVRNRCESLTHDLLAERNGRAEDNTVRTKLEITAATLKEQLEGANQKYRVITSNEKILKEKLTLSQKELLKAKRESESFQQQKVQLEAQVIKTRGMISFQLGYAMIHGLKSFRGLVNLPRTLWRIRQDVINRRKKNLILSSRKDTGTVLKNFSNDLLVKVEKPSDLSLLKISASTDLNKLRVASIMDEFTYRSYEPECNLMQLSITNWQKELELFKPELLFIESAWRGKDDEWANKVGHKSKEVLDVLHWCRDHKVPTVFWNKEDPIHFETFLSTAQLFDYIFTTDIDCIHLYKAALGHDRVFLLPFACQPFLTNPIEKYSRKDSFCFAGAYYNRYPERTRDLGNFVDILSIYRPIEIYDRNFGKEDPNYKFPDQYKPYIIGNLTFDQIDKAYKGYRYAINLNSIKNSQTMFARRIYELLASNTVTVSNFSRGLRMLFGDLVVSSDEGEEIVRRLENFCGEEVNERRFRLAGLRKVMREHTYQDRLRYIASKTSQISLKKDLPKVAIVSLIKNRKEFDIIVSSFNSQTYEERSLFLIVPDDFDIPESISDSTIHTLSIKQAKLKTFSKVAGDIKWFASFAPQDYYGPNYLMDLALASRYSNSSAIGKSTHYCWTKKMGIHLVSPNKQYKEVESVAVRSCLLSIDVLAKKTLFNWLQDLSTHQFHSSNILAIDEFNYCKNGSGREEVRPLVDDLPLLDYGIDLDQLLSRAEAIGPAEASHDRERTISGAELRAWFPQNNQGSFELITEGNNCEVISTLEDRKHHYIYSLRKFQPSELGFDLSVKLYFDITPGLNLQIVVLFLDEQNQRINHTIIGANRNEDKPIPVGTKWLQFGLRIYSSGNARINKLVLGHRPLPLSSLVGRTPYLLVTNHYPAYDDLYRNGFVHTRVKAYRESGVKVDVFRLRSQEPVSYHEFFNIDVITGSAQALDTLLCNSRYRSVLVHFLDEAIWNVLQHHVEHTKVVVWVHGAEIQPWHRRDFDFTNEAEREAAKVKSEVRMAFWRGLLARVPKNLKLVFVSRFFAETVMEDLGFRLPDDAYTIIHNPIDTDLFNYEPKPVEQRKKILSIRPYTSKKYANDLSVKAILELSKKPFFKELQFKMIGDGKLFDETLASLRQFENVQIERRFLTQSEIAQLHKEYGVFLCPTRMDSQGVSRDEAMASGLVPITNVVAAIPEFVNDSIGILAAPENAMDIASGISYLYSHPHIFKIMSHKSRERVLFQTEKNKIITAELQTFKTQQ